MVLLLLNNCPCPSDRPTQLQSQPVNDLSFVEKKKAAFEPVAFAVQKGARVFQHKKVCIYPVKW